MGFYVISNEAEFVYKCTSYYDPQSKVSIAWDDAMIGIEWPLDGLPLLSNKDRNAQPFNEIF